MVWPNQRLRLASVNVVDVVVAEGRVSPLLSVDEFEGDEGVHAAHLDIVRLDEDVLHIRGKLPVCPVRDRLTVLALHVKHVNEVRGGLVVLEVDELDEAFLLYGEDTVAGCGDRQL